MYSESDLDAAIAAGVMTPEAASALRSYIANQRTTPAADEEYFRLVTGFNDIFVSIAAVILLVALGWIGASIHPAVGGIAVAVSAWGLAEYFTRIRRMALPSILLLLAFAGGVSGAMIGFLSRHGEAMFGHNPSPVILSIIAVVIGSITAGAIWLHWRRFMVPVTVAVGTAAIAFTLIALILALIGQDMDNQNTQNLIMGLILVAGLAIFAFAMWWDISDKARQTRRSDVAFWLHLLAAPMIAHPLFTLLHITTGDNVSISAAFLVIAIYILFGIVALIIDRRALLVSALAYVLYALTQLFSQFGAVELNVALTALVIGSALLLLSAFWQNARRMVLDFAPTGIREMVPTALAAATV